MIIGITGTNGAGKGTVVDYLVKQKGFKHYSNSGLIIEEIKRRGIAVDRDNTRLVGNDLRKINGPAYLVETNYARAIAEGGDAVIEALRAIGEAQFLKSHGGILFAVDADRKVRYERAVGRGTALDKISFEHFCEQEDNEMNAPEVWDMNIQGVMAMADKIFTNNRAPEELFVQVEEALRGL